MMKRESFLTYYLDLRSSFELYFKRISKGHSAEDIHQLRVTLKKLRVIWSLAGHLCEGKLDKKEYQVLISKLFRSAGKVREAQLNSNTLKKYELDYLRPYLKYLDRIRNVAHAELHDQVNAFDLDKSRRLDDKLVSALEKLPTGKVLKVAAGLISSETKKITQLKAQRPNEEKLHKIRAHVKNIGELLVVVKQLDAQTNLDRWQDHIKSLGQRIGKWHDHVVLLASLENFSKKRLGKKGTEHIQDFVNRSRPREKARQKKIYQWVDKYIEQNSDQGVGQLLRTL